MEKIITTTYKVPVLDYSYNGWHGTAEMDVSEFESFDKAAIFELLCKEVLRTVIDDYIIDDCGICSQDWDSLQYNFERLFKNDVIMSELFTSFKINGLEYNDMDHICSFTIILQKTKDVKTDNIYLTFEY